MKAICHRKERGGARACAAQIAANGVPVNARQHPKSSPLAILSAGVANSTPLGAKLSKTLIFQKEVFPNLFLNFPPFDVLDAFLWQRHEAVQHGQFGLRFPYFLPRSAVLGV